MANPEVEILHSIDGNYYPFNYCQDGLGIHKYTINFDDETGAIKGFYPRLQRDQAFFTADWLKNIIKQQEL